MEQRGSCGPVTQRARSRSPVGTSFLGEVFWGGFLTYRDEFQKALGPQGPLISFGRNNLPCSNEWVRAWCVSYFMSCCLGDGPGIELIPHPGRLSMSLSGQKSMYVI